MRDDCIQAVTEAAAAAGRKLSQRDLDQIEQRIHSTLGSEWQNNRAEMGKMTPGERIQHISAIISKDVIAQKQKEVRTRAMDILKEAKAQKFIDANAKMGHMEALSRLFVNWLDDKVGAKSIEQLRKGFADFYGRQMEPIGKATMKFMGFWEDNKTVRDVYDEAYQEGSSGNAKARHVVKLWGEHIAEPIRNQLNELGTNIRKLPGWLIPQNHSWYKVATAGFEKWSKFQMDRLNRDAYVNDKGERMTDDDLRDQVLKPAYHNISTDGADNGVLQKKGAGDLSRRGIQSRVLHYKDGQSALENHRTFGEGNLLENMLRHINKSAEVAAGLQQFGSRDYATARRLIDYAHAKDAAAHPENLGKLQSRAHLLESEYKVATGRVGMTGNPHVARFFQGVRSILAAAHLGTAPISALTDSSNGMMVANAWNTGVQNWFRNEAKGLGSAEYRRWARSQGFGVEQISHMMSRWGEDMTGHGIPAYLANTVFRASGLNALDGARRSGLGVMLMEKIGQLVDKHDSIEGNHSEDLAKLKEAGTDENTWQVWKQAGKDRGSLSPDAIMSIPNENLSHLKGDADALKRDAAQHLIGTIARDVSTVVPMMTDRQRAKFEHSAGAKGTVMGELTRSVIQFKSFPLAMIGNHFQRMMSKGTPQGKALYALELAVTSTLLGSASVQLASLATGSNPQDMRSKTFWLKAFLKGGAGGLYADTALAPYASSFKQDLLASAGPIPSLVNELAFGLPARLKEKITEGKPGLGAEALRTLKGITPGANIWWSRAATDHLFWQIWQDHASPGYSDRVLERTQKEGNTTMWWKPGGASQPQVPDIKKAAGK